MIKRLNEHIDYLPSDDKNGPCPKIVIFHGEEVTLLLDVSSKKERLDEALSFIKEKNYPSLRYVALTHFHDDHTSNLMYLDGDIEILCSKNTARYLSRKSTLVEKDEDFDLGNYKIRLILVPSLHAKGCLDVLADSYLFVGDSLYYRQSGSSYYYNHEIAYEMLRKYEGIDFKISISAHDQNDESKEEVISFLKRLEQAPVTKIIP
jgi:glyoxylase-like metal-dependent hydrolase (beta-lactamase superfamily II)